MKKILLLGVGGNVSQGILKALRESHLNLYIVGACVSAYSSGLYLCDESLISPFANDDTFIQWVVNICNSKEIDMIMTGVEENIIALAAHSEFIKQNTKAIFVSSSYPKLLIGQNKIDTCNWLKDNGCNYPRYCDLSNKNACYQLVDSVGFPVIAKPFHGKSASGIHLIRDYCELDRLIGLEGYVLEEYLPDSTGEYTVGCYCDKFGVLTSVIVMERILRKGTTVYAKVICHPQIEAEARRICKKFKPNGPLNIQMRLNKNGEPVCFELNVRFSGSTAMRTNFGYKDVKAMVKEYLFDAPIENCFHIRRGECFRYDNEFYMFDNQVKKLSDSGLYKSEYGKIEFDRNIETTRG